MCSCLADKLKEKDIAPADNSVQSTEAVSIIQAAIASGECKLGGKLGDEIAKRTQ
jgi:hypothetical protein